MTENSAPALDASAGDLEQSVLAAAEQAFARVMTGVPDQVETMPAGAGSRRRSALGR